MEAIRAKALLSTALNLNVCVCVCVCVCVIMSKRVREKQETYMGVVDSTSDEIKDDRSHSSAN